MPRSAIEDYRDTDATIELVIGPRRRELVGLTVNRVWPTPRRRLIGPFIFLDHLELVELPAGQGLDVPPHPHIGLATVTYLFEGELMHADSLGVRQAIRPGELNWMTSGRGITHSERTSERDRSRPSRLHGIQSWVALPVEHEESEPTFEHVAAADLPTIERPGVRLKLIAGAAFDEQSPVATRSRLFYLEADLDAGHSLELESSLGERGAYVVAGQVDIEGKSYDAGRMLVVRNGRPCEIRAVSRTRLMLLGGEALSGSREIWWNFVASDAARIDQAKSDWAARRFPSVPGDDGYMPLPG
jgi:redox-sensitive bicupin YhaK (pirin superfamily)